MKKLFVAAIAFFLVAPTFAQVKKNVGIVRENHYPAFDDFLDNLSASLKSRGYNTYSDYVENYKKGGFGSGFVYVADDGENYVVTNRHLISCAESASIEFENDDGTLTRFDNLSILITDDDIDLAILRFENNARPFTSGLDFYDGKLYDGQDVASAGFPGLGNDPVWQFGKGSVTNCAARIKELIDPSISTIIQHSAQVDAGNSGGPLLVSSKNSALGYEVVGINTWKAVGRDATNFAIPSKLALNLIEKSKIPEDEETVKNGRMEKLKAILSDSTSDYTSVVKFISNDLAIKIGEDYLDEILRYGSSKIRNRVVTEFAFSPVEGLKYAVAYNLYEKFSADNATDENLSKIEWDKEHGLYRISSLGDKVKNSKPQKTASTKKDTNGSNISLVEFEGLESPYIFSLQAGAIIPLATDNESVDLNPGFDFSFGVFPLANGIIGTFVEYTTVSFKEDTSHAFGLGVLVRLPLNFSLFCLSPNVGAGFQIGFSEPTLFRFFLEAGVDVSFDFGISYIRPLLSVCYRQTFDKLTFQNSYLPDELKTSNLVISLGLGIVLE